MDLERWRRVEELYHCSSELASGERAVFLQNACGSDLELQREVESLLRHEDAAKGFIHAPAFNVAVRLMAEDKTLRPEADSVPAGTVISHFRILEKLGQGGMGVVYRAEDISLERFVALKFLPADEALDPQSLDRLRREARAASSLNHPNICTIYEIGEADHQPFIAMELVEGKTLRELFHSGALPIRKAIEVAVQVADGLAKAHESNITHRDLKPENLMVGQDGLVKILDFGLAKLAPPRGDEWEECSTSPSRTSSEGILGTVGYMSPEQASGNGLNFRSDQFSFGCVLYELVSGKRAFKRSTQAETVVAILREEPEAIGMLVPDAPAPLCWVIERCLAKEPDKRYVSTLDLARELAAIRDHFAEKPGKQAKSRPVNLPVQQAGFVGREKEVAAAKELLLRKDVRLVTVTGPGGIGKTRLAVQVASGLIEHFAAGIHFVPLSALNDSGLIASAIVQALGIREGGQSPLETLKENLGDSLGAPMLLVLDNFEHLVQAAPIVAELLTVGLNLKIMVTSRAALHVYGEHEFLVPRLALPDLRSAPSLEVLLQSHAVALFVQRAVAAKPDFEPNQENARVIAEICARLDGLPLAIELAAARVKVLSPSSMLTRLSSRLQLLTGGSRDLPQRQQTLRAAIDWSYDLLSAAEQKLFRRLSVFVGGCTLEGAEAVCNTKGDLDLDLLDGMASMVDKSLVRQIDQAKGEARFMMLETIREYALEKLEANREGPLTSRAHAAYCLVVAEEEAEGQNGAEDEERLKHFEVEHDNFRAGLDWLIQSGDVEWGLRLGAAMFRFWEIREYLAEGRDRLDRLLKLAGAASPKLRMRVLLAAGVLAGGQGDYAAADALMNESQDIAHQLGDKVGVAVSLNALAVLARDRGDIADAEILLQASLALWRETGDPKAVARALSNLANVIKLKGDYDRARQLYAECLAIFRGLGDQTCVAWSLNHEGDVAHDQGDSEGARTLYEQGLSIFRRLGDRWGIAGTLADLGSLAREQGDYPTARSLYGESIKLFRSLEHKRGIARLLECFACTAAAQTEAERSLRLAGAAAALRQNIGAPLTPAEQSKLEAALNPARHVLTNTAGATAWLEGWDLPLERAIEEGLMLHSASAPQ
jgi:predicted ATPase